MYFSFNFACDENASEDMLLRIDSADRLISPAVLLLSVAGAAPDNFESVHSAVGLLSGTEKDCGSAALKVATSIISEPKVTCAILNLFPITLAIGRERKTPLPKFTS